MPRIRTNKVRNYSCLRYDEGVELCTRLNVYRGGELFHSHHFVVSALRALSLTNAPLSRAPWRNSTLGNAGALYPTAQCSWAWDQANFPSNKCFTLGKVSNQNGNLRWHLPLGLRPPPPLMARISRHFLPHFFLLQLNPTYMKRILNFKNITFKSSYNWFKIDIHQQLRPLTANYLAMFKVISTNIYT